MDTESCDQTVEAWIAPSECTWDTDAARVKYPDAHFMKNGEEVFGVVPVAQHDFLAVVFAT